MRRKFIAALLAFGMVLCQTGCKNASKKEEQHDISVFSEEGDIFGTVSDITPECIKVQLGVLNYDAEVAEGMIFLSDEYLEVEKRPDIKVSRQYIGGSPDGEEPKEEEKLSLDDVKCGDCVMVVSNDKEVEELVITIYDDRAQVPIKKPELTPEEDILAELPDEEAVDTAENVAEYIYDTECAGIYIDDGESSSLAEGEYVTAGKNAPGLYARGNITLNEAKITAKGSEAVCIEGRHSVRLDKCHISGNMSEDTRNDCTWNILIYDNRAYDTAEHSTYNMVRGSVTAENGGIFYVTNVSADIYMEETDIKCAEECEFLLKCTGNTNERGWGKVGENGAKCTFVAKKQKLERDIIWDGISSVDIYLTEGSTYTGTFVDDETHAGAGGDGYCNMYISEDSSWTVTRDGILSSLYNASGDLVDKDGKRVTIKRSDGAVIREGNGETTIIVDAYYTELPEDF